MKIECYFKAKVILDPDGCQDLLQRFESSTPADYQQIEDDLRSRITFIFEPDKNVEGDIFEILTSQRAIEVPLTSPGCHFDWAGGSEGARLWLGAPFYLDVKDGITVEQAKLWAEEHSLHYAGYFSHPWDVYECFEHLSFEMDPK
jgi:hypothetical protein